MGVPTTLMQHPMKKILLILQKDLAEELIKKRGIVSQVSKRLCETNLIRKANKSLLCSVANKDIDFGPCVAKMYTDGYGDNEGESDDDDDDEMQDEVVTSFLLLKPLFKLNFRPKQNEDIITCLAEQSVRNRR